MRTLRVQKFFEAAIGVAEILQKKSVEKALVLTSIRHHFSVNLTDDKL
jgi:hypothetical protein